MAAGNLREGQYGVDLTVAPNTVISGLPAAGRAFQITLPAVAVPRMHRVYLKGEMVALICETITQKNMKKISSKFCAIILVFALLCSVTSALAAEDIVLTPGESVDITIRIPGISNAYGSADFDVVIDNQNVLDINKDSNNKPVISFKNGMVGQVADPRTNGNQISYMVGFYSAGLGNDFSGDLDACTITFKYIGSDPCVITVRNFKLHRYAGGTQFTTETLDLEYIYNVSPGTTTSAPTASPAAGTYNTAQTVTLSSATTGATIYYTTNGDVPTTASTQYMDPITVSRTMTIKAIAVKSGLNNSPISTFAFTINTGGTTRPGTGGNSGEVVGPDPNIPLTSVFPFADVNENDWYYDDVYYMWENELMNGVSATLFSPNTPITRGMVVTVLYRMGGEPDTSGLFSPFSDVVDGKYYTDAVIWAADNEIVMGYPGGVFRPNNSVTRQELAAMLMRYANFAPISLSESRAYTGFGDDASIADFAKEAVRTLYMAKVIGGKPNNNFDPGGMATRAEFAAMLHRMLT